MSTILLKILMLEYFLPFLLFYIIIVYVNTIQANKYLMLHAINTISTVKCLHAASEVKGLACIKSWHLLSEIVSCFPVSSTALSQEIQHWSQSFLKLMAL